MFNELLPPLEDQVGVRTSHFTSSGTLFEIDRFFLGKSAQLASTPYRSFQSQREEVSLTHLFQLPHTRVNHLSAILGIDAAQFRLHPPTTYPHRKGVEMRVAYRPTRVEN